MALNARQRIFVENYLIHKNATRAAKEAGYSEKTAHSIGPRLLENVEVKALLEEKLGTQLDKLGITSEMILKELFRLGTVDITLAFDEKGGLKKLHEIPEDVRRCLAGVEIFEEFEGYGKEREHIGDTYKVKFWDKVKSLELLGKHLKLFTDKIELEDSSSLAEKLKKFKGK